MKTGSLKRNVVSLSLVLMAAASAPAAFGGDAGEQKSPALDKFIETLEALKKATRDTYVVTACSKDQSKTYVVGIETLGIDQNKEATARSVEENIHHVLNAHSDADYEQSTSAFMRDMEAALDKVRDENNLIKVDGFPLPTAAGCALTKTPSL